MSISFSSCLHGGRCQSFLGSVSRSTNRSAIEEDPRSPSRFGLVTRSSALDWDRGNLCCALPTELAVEHRRGRILSCSHHCSAGQCHRGSVLHRLGKSRTDSSRATSEKKRRRNSCLHFCCLVRVLPVSLLEICPLAFECQLWSLRVNSARYPSNHWPSGALNFVCSLILEREVEAEIKAVARNLLKCDILLDSSHRTSSSTLRQALINKGFAETADEEHLFQVNQPSPLERERKKTLSL